MYHARIGYVVKVTRSILYMARGVVRVLNAMTGMNGVTQNVVIIGNGVGHNFVQLELKRS